MNQQSPIKLSLTIGIMAIFSLSMALMTIQPVVAKLIEFYTPDGISVVKIMYVLSLPQLMMIIASLIAGVIAGRIIKYKTLALLATALAILGGIAPTFNPDFNFLLFSRCFYGFGLGVLTVLGNPLVSAFYSGDRKARILSIGTFMSSFGAMVLQLFGGFLADIDLKYTYLTHALCLIPFILILLFLQEPPTEKLQLEQKTEKGPLPARVIGLSIFFGLVSLCGFMPTMNNFSVVIAKLNTSAAVAAVAMVIFSIGTMTGGLFYMPLYKFARRFSIAISCLIGALGITIVLYGGSVPVIYLGMFIAGIGFNSILPAVLMIVGQVTKPTLIPFATSIVFVVLNGAGFLVAPYIGLIAGIPGTDPVMTPISLSPIILCILAVIMFLFNPYPKNIKTDQQITAK